MPRAPAREAATVAPATGTRDIRLDFFRGLAMFIILAAHTPRNFVTSWIPARWGFSDATEIFVFCSGMASAIAFGRTFDRAGWRLGSARVGYRVWQVYWAHLGLFFAVATLMAAIDHFGDFDKVYIGSLNLWKFFADPGPQLVGLFTLTYVPNYFDILPMYMVILVMMPLMMALSRVSVWAVFAVMAVIWLFAQRSVLDALGMIDLHLGFPAEPWSDRKWFFNPFGWQLVFFTGFALMRGWIPKPPVNKALIALALVIVLANVPLSHIGMREFGFDWARDWRIANSGLLNKSDFGILRYVHFLSLAYLCWAAAGDGGARLRTVGRGIAAQTWGGLLAMILKVGQQSLAVFVFSMFLARLSGFVMDQIGRNTWNMTLANIIGFAALVVVAYAVSWFKAQPWRAAR
ncbi:OpgC family protein [Roseovarius nitratireducens]|uniref:OpgC family protein n=1 Tax=Roseovarius nitratireducens TaxID=2044597 RepID=UPI001F0B8235|nr:OpgC domain-containing protein [Roseovarius nitratireducens]